MAVTLYHTLPHFSRIFCYSGQISDVQLDRHRERIRTSGFGNRHFHVRDICLIKEAKYLPSYFLMPSLYRADYTEEDTYVSTLNTSDYYDHISFSKVSIFNQVLSNLNYQRPARMRRFPGVLFEKNSIKIKFPDLVSELQELFALKLKYSPFVKKQFLRPHANLEGVKKQTSLLVLPYIELACENFTTIPSAERSKNFYTKEGVETEEKIEERSQKLVLFVASDIHKILKENPTTKTLAVAIEKTIIEAFAEKNVRIMYCPSEHITRNVFNHVNLSLQFAKKKNILKRVIQEVYKPREETQELDF